MSERARFLREAYCLISDSISRLQTATRYICHALAEEYDDMLHSMLSNLNEALTLLRDVAETFIMLYLEPPEELPKEDGEEGGET